jgi:hypothetical protein
MLISPPRFPKPVFWNSYKDTLCWSKVTKPRLAAVLITDLIFLSCLYTDNPLLQVCDLQAIKRCMVRTKTYLSGLEPILRSEFLYSPSMEKQQVNTPMDDSERYLIIVFVLVDWTRSHDASGRYGLCQETPETLLY